MTEKINAILDKLPIEQKEQVIDALEKNLQDWVDGSMRMVKSSGLEILKTKEKDFDKSLKAVAPIFQLCYKFGLVLAIQQLNELAEAKEREIKATKGEDYTIKPDEIMSKPELIAWGTPKLLDVLNGIFDGGGFDMFKDTKKEDFTEAAEVLEKYFQ